MLTVDVVTSGNGILLRYFHGAYVTHIVASSASLYIECAPTATAFKFEHLKQGSSTAFLRTVDLSHTHVLSLFAVAELAQYHFTANTPVVC